MSTSFTQIRQSEQPPKNKPAATECLVVTQQDPNLLLSPPILAGYALLAMWLYIKTARSLMVSSEEQSQSKGLLKHF
jgi:hypothetical protein